MAAVAVLSGACSGGDDTASPSSTTVAVAPTPTPSTDPGSSSTPTSGRPVEQPVPGGVLRVGVERPRTLDPAFASPGSQSELLIADLLFDALTTVPPGGAGAVPAVAESWAHTPDFKTWQFTVRAGATFTNARPIGAVDVKYSLERIARLGEGSPAAVRLEIINGWAAWAQGTAPELVGVRVVSERVVEFVLDTPLSSFPDLLSAPQFAIVPKESVESGSPAFGAAPLGSGPFSYGGAEGDTVHLVRSPGGTALLDGIDLFFFDDIGSAYTAFTGGGLDWSPVPPDSVDDATASYGTGGFVPFDAEALYGFNVANPKFADVRFRQAIVAAIDRDAIVRAVYFGVANSLHGLVPFGVTGASVDPCGSICGYSPNASRALLAQVFPPGTPVPEIKIDYYEGANEEAVATIIETDLEAVGIPATRRPLPFDQYQQFVSSGQQELFRFSWFGLYAAPEAFIGPLVATGSKDNVTGFSDASVDQLLSAARSDPDPASRAAKYTAVEQAVLQRVPLIPIAQFLTRVVIASRVRGLVQSVTGTFDGRAIWLAR